MQALQLVIMTGTDASPEPPFARRQDPLAELVRNAASGDLAATRQIIEAVAPPVLRVVRSVLGGAHADVDDVTQESLMAFVRALPAFRGECGVTGYACRIAVRTAVAARRRVRRNDERLDGLRDATRALPEPVPTPSQEVARERRKALLRELLDELPEAQAETFALRVVLGHSLQEVADATGAPVNTVRSRLRLAREALRSKIECDPALASELLPEVTS